MKKLFLLALSLILFLSLNLLQTTHLAYFNYAENATYVVISKEDNPHLVNVDKVVNGNSFIVKTKGANARYVFKNSNKIISEAWEIETNNTEELVKKIVEKLKLKVISYENLGEIFVINGQSKLIKNYVLNKNTKQNIQIAVKENCVIVATPLILHSY